MSKRLLLVEDENKLREQLLEILQRHEYTVDACSDGMEGLYVAQKYQYDVAIIDLGLPKVSGKEIIEQVPMALHKLEAAGEVGVLIDPAIKSETTVRSLRK